MTNQEIENNLRRLIQNEREITNEILSLIGLADQRRLFIEKGYSTLFDWLVRGFGYSESAAQRRIQAARLIRSVPEITEKLSNGDISLSSISKAQSIMRLHEKQSGETLSNEEKSSVVKKIEHKSSRETEKVLLELFPETASKVKKDKTTSIDEKTTRIALNISNETMKELERVKELLSHTLPHGSLGEVIQYLSGDFLKRRDPLRKPIAETNNRSEIKTKKLNAKGTGALDTAATKRCVDVAPTSSDVGCRANPLIITAATKKCVGRPALPAAVKRKVFQAANGKCNYIDRSTGKMCGSGFQLEVDHIYPRALGGEDTFENLRCLCRVHNRFVATQVLGADILTVRR